MPFHTLRHTNTLRKPAANACCRSNFRIIPSKGLLRSLCIENERPVYSNWSNRELVNRGSSKIMAVEILDAFLLLGNIKLYPVRYLFLSDACRSFQYLPHLFFFTYFLYLRISWIILRKWSIELVRTIACLNKKKNLSIGYQSILNDLYLISKYNYVSIKRDTFSGGWSTLF